MNTTLKSLHKKGIPRSAVYIEQLKDALVNASNVKTLFYDKDSDVWEITFYKGEPNKIDSDHLIDFLTNA